MFVVELSFES